MRILIVTFVLAIGLGALLASSVSADEMGSGSHRVRNHSLAGEVLLYLPNRILDIFDLFRARAKLGAGLSATAHAGKSGWDAGHHDGVYVGMPGGRNRTTPKLPLGFESDPGSPPGDALFPGPETGPDRADTEVGVGGFLGLVGVELGVDYMEWVDFFGGFILMDPKHDDY